MNELALSNVRAGSLIEKRVRDTRETTIERFRVFS
jgi:hypothetical protein